MLRGVISGTFGLVSNNVQKPWFIFLKPIDFRGTCSVWTPFCVPRQTAESQKRKEGADVLQDFFLDTQQKKSVVVQTQMFELYK